MTHSTLKMYCNKKAFQLDVYCPLIHHTCYEGGGTSLPTCEHIDRHLWWLPQRQNYSPEFEFGLLTLLLQPLVPNMKTSGDILAATSLNFYRPQRSWGKVMFLQASVILSTGEGCLSACWDTTPGGRHPP